MEHSPQPAASGTGTAWENGHWLTGQRISYGASPIMKQILLILFPAVYQGLLTVHVLRILLAQFFIVICPSVSWLLGNKIVYDIIGVYGKMVSFAEVGYNLAYEPGMQGANLLPDDIIRKF